VFGWVEEGISKGLLLEGEKDLSKGKNKNIRKD
jgi:hypothetical protein